MLTAEQIGVMDKQEVLDHLVEVAEANKRARSTNNEELLEQLKEQRELLMARLRELNAS